MGRYDNFSCVIFFKDGVYLQIHDPHPHALLENPESETRWYFKYFLAKSEFNYAPVKSICTLYLLLVCCQWNSHT